MGETGTPLLASPLRAYAMFKILRRGKPLREDLASYEDFVKHFANIEMVAEDGGKKPLFGRALRKSHKKITGYRNLDELRDLIAPYCSVVLRDDVEDMPDLIEVERPIVMSEKQRKAYLEMVSRHLVDLDAGLVTAKDAGPRMMKLQQILNGYIIDSTTGEIINVDDAAPIYEALVEEVNGTLPGKTIVWCRYHEDVDRCIMALRRAGHQCLQFDGRVPQSRRESIRLAFNNDPRYTVVVGHPGAGGEGRDFSEADCIIYFSSTPNAIHVAQGRERGTAKGKLKPITIVRFHTHGTVDDRNWKLADGKFVVADSVSGQGLRDVLMATDV
jgi:SNF2 family DNA or RNA helicase